MTATGTGALRERIAKAMFEAGRVDRGPEYGAVDWQYIRGRHRESWLRLADAAISALTAAGSPVGDAGLTREQGDAVIAGLSAIEHRLADHLRRRREAERCQSPDVAMYQQIIDRDRKHIAVLRALAAQGAGGG